MTADFSTLACSEQARSIGEPLPGTAPQATAWVVIEQAGAWGAKALLDADLPDGVGPAVARASSGSGTGVLLARHPDRTVRQAHTSTQGTRVWVADVRGASAKLCTGFLDDVSAVAHWDFHAIAAGSLPAAVEPTTDPLLLVCTQGHRDACCARIGRPSLDALLQALGPTRRHLAWEASHIGGHRFAPTLLALPTGSVHGRVDGTQAHLVLQGTVRMELVDLGLRGRTCLSPPAQVADVVIRQHINDWRVPSLTLTSQDASDGEVSVEVRHQDGREWTVLVIEEPLARPRAESCGADLRNGSALRVTAIHAA